MEVLLNFGNTDTELCNCCCGRNRILSVRIDLPKMKNLAKKFEKDQMVHEAEEILKHDHHINKVHFQLCLTQIFILLVPTSFLLKPTEDHLSGVSCVLPGPTGYW